MCYKDDETGNLLMTVDADYVRESLFKDKFKDTDSRGVIQDLKDFKAEDTSYFALPALGRVACARGNKCTYLLCRQGGVEYWVHGAPFEDTLSTCFAVDICNNATAKAKPTGKTKRLSKKDGKTESKHESEPHAQEPTLTWRFIEHQVSDYGGDTYVMEIPFLSWNMSHPVIKAIASADEAALDGMQPVWLSRPLLPTEGQQSAPKGSGDQKTRLVCDFSVAV